MENSSFRDILLKFLEENQEFSPLETAPPVEKPKITEHIPHLEWQAPDLKMVRKNPYTQAPRPQKSRLAKVSSPRPPENRLQFAQLLAADQNDVQLLIVLGADFRDGVSLPRLKKAHRALVKELHPDHLDKSLTGAQRDLAQEKFLVLQAAYERLSRSLPLYKSSESASGSESA